MDAVRLRMQYMLHEVPCFRASAVAAHALAESLKGVRENRKRGRGGAARQGGMGSEFSGMW